jgi:hypothetical protein
MRALYRALVELRGLAAQRKLKSFKSVEACWVGTAIDLRDGDLTSDAGAEHEAALLEHIRAVGKRENAEPVKRGELRRLLKHIGKQRPEAFPGTPLERLLCAVGAAMALKAANTGNVALAFVHENELAAAEWRRLFPLIGQDELPLVLTVLPDAQPLDLEAISRRAAPSPDQAVPVIPVDAGDAVALYRVAQESFTRARAGGGAAVILGVACKTDPVKLLGKQLVRKGICTERWVKAVQPHMTDLLEKA